MGRAVAERESERPVGALGERHAMRTAHFRAGDGSSHWVNTMRCRNATLRQRRQQDVAARVAKYRLVRLVNAMQCAMPHRPILDE